MMEIQVAVSKVGKYATQESGDTLEMIERPHGGISFVLVDGQRSGRSAKAISNIVARKAISLLADGVRDGAVARAAHDYLYTQRGGKVSATLNIASIDMVTKTLVLSRNNHCPIYVINQQEVQLLDEESSALGIYRHTKPSITELPLEVSTTVVIFTDGVLNAGVRTRQSLDIAQLLQKITPAGSIPAKEIAQALFEAAYALEQGRPTDDISLLVITILDKQSEGQGRHMTLQFPL